MSPARRLVVGAIIVDDLERPRRLLAARRSSPTELAGKWEFPGGKVEPGETAIQALEREIIEELGVEIVVANELEHPDGGWPISEKYCLKLFFATTEVSGIQPGPSHDETRWLTEAELDTVDWLPSDAEAVVECRRFLGQTLGGGRNS